jgi:hypothetical protein
MPAMSANRSLLAIALCALLASASSQAQTRTDEYTRYELLPPGTSAVRVTYEVSERERSPMKLRQPRG